MTDELKQIDYYGGYGDEQLYHTTEREYIESILDNEYENQPKEITVCAFKRMVPSVDEYTHIFIDDLLERLDEEYGSPEGDIDKPTKGMIEAECIFIKAVIAEYHPWACEEVSRRVVSIAKWKKERECLTNK